MRKFKKIIASIATLCTLFSMASVTNAAVPLKTSTFYVSAGSSKYSSQTVKLDGKKQHYQYAVELKSFKFDYIPQNAAPSAKAQLNFRLCRKISSNRYPAGACIVFDICGFTGKHLTKGATIWKSYKSGKKTVYSDGGLKGEYCLKTNSSNCGSLGYGCTVDWQIK